MIDTEKVETQIFYIKGTLKGGDSVAKYEPKIHYKLGMNIHPSPDKTDTLCSAGIHLAKSLKSAKRLCPEATEFYLAKSGVIYAEDSEKIRTGSAEIVMKLDTDMIYALGGIELPKDWHIPDNPLCGQDWFQKHWHKVSQQDIDNQRLTVKTDRQEVCLSPKLKKKDIREILGAIA